MKDKFDEHICPLELTWTFGGLKFTVDCSLKAIVMDG